VKRGSVERRLLQNQFLEFFRRFATGAQTMTADGIGGLQFVGIYFTNGFSTPIRRSARAIDEVGKIMERIALGGLACARERLRALRAWTTRICDSSGHAFLSAEAQKHASPEKFDGWVRR